MFNQMLFSSFATLILSQAPAQAASTCSYRLDQQAYVGKDDGDLVLDGKAFRCETYRIGVDEKTLCKKVGSRSKNFALVIAFDGAENDFIVSLGLDPAQFICQSTATSKKDKGN